MKRYACVISVKTLQLLASGSTRTVLKGHRRHSHWYQCFQFYSGIKTENSGAVRETLNDVWPSGGGSTDDKITNTNLSPKWSHLFMRTEFALNLKYKKQVHFFSFLLFELKKSLCRLTREILFNDASTTQYYYKWTLTVGRRRCTTLTLFLVFSTWKTHMLRMSRRAVSPHNYLLPRFLDYNCRMSWGLGKVWKTC